MARDTPGRDLWLKRQNARHDTPGRDAHLMRQAAQQRTRAGLGLRHKPSNFEDLAKLPGAKASSTLSQFLREEGLHPKQIPGQLKQSVSDAYWSVTHPIDRLTGKGRAKDQAMIWPGPFKLHPAPVWDVPGLPDWQIRRAKEGDPYVGLVRKEIFPGQVGRESGREAMRREQLREYSVRLARERARLEGVPMTDAAARQVHRDTIISMEDFVNMFLRKQLDLVFNAYHKANPAEPRASIKMQLRPDTTFVDTLVDKGDTGWGWGTEKAPFPSIMELMQTALGPEKPITSYVVNPKLARVMNLKTRRSQIPFKNLYNP